MVQQIGDGSLSASFVLALIQRLPDESMTVAMYKGGREKWQEHFGWGTDRHLAANLFDAIQINTRATGNWAKKAPDMPMTPRPKVEKAKPKVNSVAELHRLLFGAAQKDKKAEVLNG